MPTAFAAGPYQIVEVTPATAAPGDTVNVKITLPEGIETAGSFTIDMKFDKDIFEVTEIKRPPRLTATNEEYAEEEKVSIVIVDLAGANTNGVLACNAAYTYNTMKVAGVTVIDATLKVKEGASGTAEFSFDIFEITKSEGGTQYIVKKEDVAPPPSITITDMAAEYGITVTSGKATVEGNPATTAAEGKTVTITANAAPSGKKFDKWVVDSGTITLGNAASKTTTFTMPASEVSVRATYRNASSGGSSVSTYAITVKDAKNGDVSANRKSASKGTTITLTVTPDKGYVLDTITVLDSKNQTVKLTPKDGKFTFPMPASAVTVKAAFKAEAPVIDHPFTDVPEGSYYEDAVIWAVDKGITGGTSATTFSPNGICTRAQAVTFLWRAAGSPEPKTSTMPFTDVKAGSYYYDAVLWAVEQGITAGTSATTFAPDLNCSRAQIVTFLYRAAGSPAVSGSPAFSDVASDAYYAKAVKWAQANGITSGIGGGLFGSNDNCTRAQIVTFIYRYMEK